MSSIDTRAAKATWTAALVLGALYSVWLIRETVLLFVVALLFAYLISPVADLVQRALPALPRAPALAIVYISLIAALGTGAFFVGTAVAEQAASLASKAPEYLARLERPPGGGPLEAVLKQARSQIEGHSTQILAWLSKAGLSVLLAAGNIVYVALVPVLSFFFLKDAEVLRRYLLSWAAETGGSAAIEEALRDLHLLLAQYMRALVLLSAAAFAAYALFFSLAGVPYPLLLAALGAPLEFIPIIGPLIAAALVLGVDGFSGFGHTIPLLIFLALYRLFQDYVVSPLLLSEGMELHPLAVMFGAFAGAEMGGVAGAFLSVPVMAALRVVYRRVAGGKARTR
jgi:predicted PurR-regulated permease PerM